MTSATIQAAAARSVRPWEVDADGVTLRSEDGKTWGVVTTAPVIGYTRALPYEYAVWRGARQVMSGASRELREAIAGVEGMVYPEPYISDWKSSDYDEYDLTPGCEYTLTVTLDMDYDLSDRTIVENLARSFQEALTDVHALRVRLHGRTT